MPEQHIDVAVANRFISSLSKSLQALCHGCMDFDNGIEIVGYINVNIDSGSKVDYVLNEKVMKGTTNSMTFVSNSFLAKKEQQKQTRDGACSPILQLKAPPYPPHVHGAHTGSHYHRGVSYPRSHMSVPHKRPRVDDWGVLPKRHQPQQSSSTDTGQITQHPHPASSYTNKHLKQSQATGNSSHAVDDSTYELQMSIKKEAPETTDSQKSLDQEHLSQLSEDQKLDSGDSANLVQVKKDPDADNLDNGKETPDSDTPVSGADADLKRNFLEELIPEDSNKLANENTSQLESENQLVDYDLESTTEKSQDVADELTAPSTSTAKFIDSNAGTSADSDSVMQVPPDYDLASQDESYSHPSYDDAGEGSSDPGQFEVIEIDDEDEDVQAMFGEHHKAHSSLFQPLDTPCNPQQLPNVKQNTSYFQSQDQFSRNKEKQSFFVIDPNSRMYKCLSCGKQYKTSTGARIHFKIKHCGAFDHYCQACGKGFQQKSHLRAHMSLHMQQKDFECSICGCQYAHKTSLTAHQKVAHGTTC